MTVPTYSIGLVLRAWGTWENFALFSARPNEFRPFVGGQFQSELFSWTPRFCVRTFSRPIKQTFAPIFGGPPLCRSCNDMDFRRSISEFGRRAEERAKDNPSKI